MTVGIGYQNAIAGSVSLAMQTGSAAAGLPLANLLDEQPRVRARLVGTTVAFSIDLQAETAMDWVALIDTTIPAGATIQADASNTDPTGATAEEGTASVTAAGTSASRYNVHIPASGWSARYLRITVSGLSAGCDIGLAFAGPVMRLSYGIQGLEEGRLMLDGRDRNPRSGVEFNLPSLMNPRYVAGTLARLTRAEIAGGMRTLLEGGAVADVLFIPSMEDTQAELSARCIWGSINDAGSRAGLRRAGILGARNFVVTDRA